MNTPLHKSSNIESADINICYCTDSAYVQHCIVSLCSLLKNARASDTITVYIVSTFLTEEDKKHFSAITQIRSFVLHFVVLDEALLANFPVHGYITSTAYARLTLPHILPQHVSKVIYIDCDTVVLDSLHELYACDVEQYFFAAVPDMSFRGIQDIFLQKNKKYICEYYNSGVLLINMRKCRESFLLEKAYECCAKIGIPSFWDQDILNYIFTGDDILILPIKYNFMCWFTPHDLIFDLQMLGSLQEKSGAPCIVHYISALKPWQATTLEMLGSKYAGKYFDYLSCTPFKDFVPENGFLLQKGSKVALVSLTTPGVESAAIARLLRVCKDIHLDVFSVNTAHSDQKHEKVNQHVLSQPAIGKAVAQAVKARAEMLIFLFPKEQMESGCAQLSLLTAQVKAKVYVLDAYANRITTIKSSPVVVSRFTILLNAVKQRISAQKQYATLKKSAAFEERFYLFTYPDVLAQHIDPLRHYLLHGSNEGRNPSPWFNTQQYLRANPDVQKSGLNPLYHYVRYGCREGRKNT